VSAAVAVRSMILFETELGEYLGHKRFLVSLTGGRAILTSTRLGARPFTEHGRPSRI
jgi:hypothetical protein